MNTHRSKLKEAIKAHLVPLTTEDPHAVTSNQNSRWADMVILQVDPETAKIVGTYDSLADAEHQTLVSGDKISKSYSGKSFKTGGYKWVLYPKELYTGNHRRLVAERIKIALGLRSIDWTGVGLEKLRQIHLILNL